MPDVERPLPNESKLELFSYGSDWQDYPAEKLVEDLGQTGINRAEPAENAFPPGKMPEARASISEIAVSEQEKKNRQGQEDDLQGAVQAQGADEHHTSKQ